MADYFYNPFGKRSGTKGESLLERRRKERDKERKAAYEEALEIEREEKEARKEQERVDAEERAKAKTEGPKTSFLDKVSSFATTAADKIGGGIGRGALRTADLLLPGKNTGGLEGLAEEWDKRAQEDRQHAPDKKAADVGATVGSTVKGVADVAAIAAPVAAVDKVVKGTKLVRNLRKGGKVAKTAGYGARVLPGSAAATGVEAVQEVGRGNDPNLARSAAIGTAVDLALPGVGKLVRTGFKRLKDRGAETAADEVVKKLDDAGVPDAEVATPGRMKLGRTTPAGQTDTTVTQITPETPTVSSEALSPAPEPTPPTTLTKPQRVKTTSTVGTPKLAQGVRKKAMQEKLIYGFDKTFKDMPEYDKVNVKEQGQKATELVLNSPDEAFEIAMGRKAAPEGLLPESVFVAVERYALDTKNVDAIRELALRSNLTSEATGMGQRIRMLAERDPESAVGAMQAVSKAREAAAAKRLGKPVNKAIRETTTEIRRSIKSPTKTEWAMFIESVKC